ncbi:1,6-anhydro-N-acetylmuramyl-L-alanine amidase AmpD [Methylophaga sp. SB9B]|uniref:1,6-anhydro-N-acetylmuramyl-L-alanine amidase AmpD n=1 Tax=Methylophaga sp. SB9B TaxID=2570356 RepID=UPI0010A8E30A|nr:1,6-anhydro-N-acetylmuramyl-L-alanine amidase AmpD [Methylophaga sp. SB9B]THK42009.1 1,6-anhydro-N-acetylmuramyl-L-alanine amidase AmpD [Methylophaga sp. SB9B]
MIIDRQSGWLDVAEILPSPNYDDRLDENDISGIVIHNISLPPGQFGGGWITDLFLNRLDPNAHPYFAEIAHLKVSAHLLIRRDGLIQQFVPFHKRAWHAGVSCWEGRERCNDFTIGIELEGDDETAFTEVQYLQLAAVSRALLSSYPLLSEQRITGHEHIAPGRKTDPGPHFDWPRYKLLLQA